MKFEYIIILILLVYFYKVSVKDYLAEKKNSKFIRENLEISSKVLTKSGIVGDVISIEGESLVIITGSADNNSYLEILIDEIKTILE
ncbi:preprotein translocase subunit YajC [Anaerococcus sp. AGMB09787]|uniref:preprotein translocase subunit YajC n=1 Tax=Anaerococcus sp. AGMB09787 TaxID=2922869 RepID=UPI001FAFBFEF|nr:preprotein translocase subunit YajC [Anaerococcus sp. AGMB09787]